MAKLPNLFPHELLLSKHNLVPTDLSAAAQAAIKTFDAALSTAEKVEADKLTDGELANLNKLSGLVVADINDFISEQQEAAEEAEAAAKAASEAAAKAAEAEQAAAAARAAEDAAAVKAAEDAAAAAKLAAEKAAEEARKKAQEEPRVGIWAMM